MSNIESGIPSVASYREPSLVEKFIARTKRMFAKKQESNLVRHAEYELRRAGFYDKDSDYGGMIGKSVMKMVRVLSTEGHSGMSHIITMAVFNRVANFKTLADLTNDPEEWMDVSGYGAPGSAKCWQSRRQSSCFSNDGGKTYYDIDDKTREVKTAADYNKST